MSEYKDTTDNYKSHINTLRAALAIISFGLVVSLLINALQAQEPEAQRLSIPPDLRYGANILSGQINIWEVYEFAGKAYQLVNTWQEDGQTEYIDNIKKYNALFTPRFIAQKVKDYRANQSRLLLRQRSIMPMGAYVESDHCGTFADSCVKPLGANRWKVWLDVNLREYQQTSNAEIPPYEVKNQILRIPLLVIYENDNSEYNPWGLKIDYEYSKEVQEFRIEDIQQSHDKQDKT